MALCASVEKRKQVCLSISFDEKHGPFILLWGKNCTTHNATVRYDSWDQLLPWKYFIYRPLQCWHSAAPATLLNASRIQKPKYITMCFERSRHYRQKELVWKPVRFVIYKLFFFPFFHSALTVCTFASLGRINR